MSAFMIDLKDYLAFAVQLHRFCNAPMPPHYTLELLRTLWWMPPADTTSTWAWRVDRLVRLMMLANRRAVWHRYQLGRQQERKEPRQHRSNKLSPLKSAHRYHQAPLTDAELVALYKFTCFTCCALYQSSEWSGSSEQTPPLVKVIQQLQQALAQDVLTRLSLWEQAPGERCDGQNRRPSPSSSGAIP